MQELVDASLVEQQIQVQRASQGEAEIHAILKQLIDLQTSMCKTNQQKEEVSPPVLIKIKLFLYVR